MSVAVAERVDHDKTVERAMSDYLAVSRSPHLYTSSDYDRAETAAWDALMAARAARDEAMSD